MSGGPIPDTSAFIGTYLRHRSIKAHRPTCGPAETLLQAVAADIVLHDARGRWALRHPILEYSWQLS